jgi:hypothetical protein
MPQRKREINKIENKFCMIVRSCEINFRNENLHNAETDLFRRGDPSKGVPLLTWEFSRLTGFFRDSVESVKLCFLPIPKKSMHYTLDSKTLLTRVPGEPVGLHSGTDAVPNISSYFMSQICRCSGHNHTCVLVV